MHNQNKNAEEMRFYIIDYLNKVIINDIPADLSFRSAFSKSKATNVN